jgi:hypothetical protein
VAWLLREKKNSQQALVLFKSNNIRYKKPTYAKHQTLRLLCMVLALFLREMVGLTEFESTRMF